MSYFNASPQNRKQAGDLSRRDSVLSFVSLAVKKQRKRDSKRVEASAKCVCVCVWIPYALTRDIGMPATRTLKGKQLGEKERHMNEQCYWHHSTARQPSVLHYAPISAGYITLYYILRVLRVQTQQAGILGFRNNSLFLFPPFDLEKSLYC